MGGEQAELANAAAAVQVRILEPARHRPGERADPTESRLINAGSGIVVDPDGLIVTNGHIALSTQHTAEVVTLDGRRLAARIVAIAPRRELALLRLWDDARLTVARPTPGKPPLTASPVAAVGAPGNRPGAVAHGSVRQPRSRQRIDYGAFGFSDPMVLDLGVEPGFSGGPVFDRDGRMVGMVTGFLLGDTSRVDYVSPGIAYAIPAADILAWLSEVEPDRF